MKKIYRYILAGAVSIASLSAAAQSSGYYQIPNGGFELEWTSGCEPGGGLHSFDLATGTLKAQVNKHTSEQVIKVEGRESASACKIKSVTFKAVGITVKANGNLTSGVIVANGASTTSKDNHNESQIKSETTSLKFAGLPDSISFYTKYSRGDDKGQFGNANFIIHGPVNYVDTYQGYYDEKNGTNYEKEYLNSYNTFVIPVSTDWVRNVQAVEYKTPTKSYTERYLLTSFTTNPTPAQTSGDELVIDDIEFIYNSKLESVAFNGKKLEGFDKNKFAYEIDEEFSEDIEVSAVSDGKFANIIKAVNITDYTVTITVMGNDISVSPTNKHEYVFKFKEPKAPAVQILSAKYIDNVISEENGEEVNTTDQVIYGSFYDNDLCTMKLENFTAGKIKYGTIFLSDIPYKTVADSFHFSTTQKVEIGGTYASLGEATVTMTGATDGKGDKLRAEITLNIGSAITQKLKYGYEYIEPVRVLLKDSKTDCTSKGGELSETEAKITIYNYNKADIEFLGKEYKDLTYTLENGVYSIKGDGIESLYSKDSFIITSGDNTFGKCIIPKIIKNGKYEDYVIISESGIAEKPVITKVEIDFYNTGIANIRFTDLDIAFDNVPYTTSDSIYLKSENVEGASTTMCFKLRLLAKVGEKTLDFGTYKDGDKRPQIVDSRTFTDHLFIKVNDNEGEPTEETVKADFYDDETVTISIKDFKLDTLLVGDIKVSLPYKIEGDSIIVSGKQIAHFTSDDDEAYGPFIIDSVLIDLKRVAISTDYTKMSAELSIDMTETTNIKQLVTVQFGKRVKIKSMPYTDNFQLVVDGEESEVTKETITIDYYDNGEATLSIMDFYVGDQLVGDIRLDGVTYTKDEDSIRISGKQVTKITSDDHLALGNSLGDIPIEIASASSSLDFKKLQAVINVDMTELLNQNVVIRFGYPVIPKVNLVESAEYTDTLTASVNGAEATGERRSITIDYYDNDLATITLKGLKYGDTTLGDLVIDSIAYKIEKDSIRLGGKRDVVVKGNEAIGTVSVDVKKAVSSLNHDKLKAEISLNIASKNEEVGITFGIAEKKTEPQIEVTLVKKAEYSDMIGIYVDKAKKGTTKGTATVSYYSDNLATISIPDFSYGGTLLGDIVIDSIAYKTDEDSIRMKGERTIRITSNNKSAQGSSLGDIKATVSFASSSIDYKKLQAYISLDITQTLGSIIGIEFGKEEEVVTPPNPDVVSKTYTDQLQVTVNDEKSEPQTQSIKIDYASDGTCTLSLYNFTFKSEGKETLVGDIILDGISYSKDKDSIRIKGSQIISIKSDNKEALGPSLGKVPVVISSAASSLDYKSLKALIDIDMSENLGQIINVSFGYAKASVNPSFTIGKAVYSDSLVVTVDGESAEPQLTDIIVDYAADGTCTLSIMNFVMGSGDEAIAVGDIIVPGVKYVVGTDSVRLTGNNVITIDSEMGAILGEIPVSMRNVASTLDKGKLKAVIDIDMSATIGQNVEVTFGYTSINNTPVLAFTPGLATYSDSLVVTVDGESAEPQLTDITVDYASDGTCTLSIMNFVMGSGDEAIAVGDIIVPGVKYVVGTDSVRLIGSNVITIDSEMGALLGEIPVSMRNVASSLDKGKLKAVIDIDMSATIGQNVEVTFGFTSLNSSGTGGDKPVIIDSITYHDSIHIYVKEKSCTDDVSNISVAFFSDNTAKIIIHDLTILDEEGKVLLGDATFDGVPVIADGDSLRFQKTICRVTFDSDDEDAIGSYFGEVSCQVTSGATDAKKTKLRAKFDLWLPNSNVAISFGYESPVGLKDIASELVNDKRVYTISGMYLGEDIDINSLPNGMYIKGGKVIMVRR